ncbi:MAG: hypothetical protein NXI22_08010 [bacterium]|nr:hypothetical protein [bacterium]
MKEESSKRFSVSGKQEAPENHCVDRNPSTEKKPFRIIATKAHPDGFFHRDGIRMRDVQSTDS